jgi:hypothetical protein
LADEGGAAAQRALYRLSDMCAARAAGRCGAGRKARFPEVVQRGDVALMLRFIAQERLRVTYLTIL